MTSQRSRFDDASDNLTAALGEPHHLRTAGIWGAWATLVMSVPMLLGTIAGTSPMPEPVPVAGVKVGLGLVGVALPKAAVVLLGFASHLLYGALWGAVGWAVLRIDGAVEGVAFGVGLWVLMGLVVLPILGWGPFGVGVAVPIAVVTLALHLIYGACLGAAYERVLPEAAPAGRRTGTPAGEPAG